MGFLYVAFRYDVGFWALLGWVSGVRWRRLLALRGKGRMGRGQAIELVDFRSRIGEPSVIFLGDAWLFYLRRCEYFCLPLLQQMVCTAM